MNKNNFLISMERTKRFNQSLFLLVLPFFLLMFIPNISADKVLTTPQHGLQINSWEIGTIPQSQSYNLVWDVSDAYGQLLNNTEVKCFTFLQKAGTTSVLIGGSTGNGSNPPGDKVSWYKIIPASNLSQSGMYNYQIDCYRVDNASVSGNLLDTFEVTKTGQSATDNRNFLWILLVIAGAFILLGIWKLDANITMLGDIMLFGVSLYFVINGINGIKDNYTYIFSITLIGISIVIAAKVMEEWLNNLNELK